MIPPLFDHQVTSIDFLKGAERALDLSDPGTGKTRVEIEDFHARRKRNGGCALVIAPKSLLRSAWQDDFQRFAPQLVTVICPAERREASFAKKADVYITNHDAVKWLAKQPKQFFLPFDTLIIDESTAFKHYNSGRSKALKKIKDFFRYRRAMTGTPNANGITDIWHQALIIDDGKRLGTSFWAFRSATCTPKQVGPMPNMLEWEPKPGIENVVAKLLEDITVRHVFEECISIPANHLYSVNYHLSSTQMKAYQDMERDMILRLAPQIVAAKMGIKNAAKIDAVNAAVLLQKLLQISSGAVYDDAGNYHLIDSGRYELVADLVEARDNCVVFFLWKHQKEELISEFNARGITYTLIDSTVNDRDRATAVERFQAGFYKVCLAHPQSAAHGLTMTRGTSTIWPSPTHNLEHFLQGNRRIYRAGQTQKTESVVVLAPGTREQKVFDSLTNKDARQRDLLALFGD